LIVRYARIGGRVPPPDNEGLEVDNDGSFTMWRSIAPAVGRFAGKLATADMSRLKTEAAKAAAQGDVSLQPTMDGSAERFEVEGATATMGSDDYVEGPWGELTAHVRKLLGDLVSKPLAAVGLEVGKDGRSARLVHLGDKPLRVDLSKLSVRAVLWGRGFQKLGDWSAEGKSGPGPSQAADSWNAPLPFDHDLKPGKNKVLHVSATFAVSENGQRVDVRVEHTPSVPA
jgi:hypothetical protein